jgi:type I restriction enzyme S subunit
LSDYRLDGTFALIGEDGDHFLKFNRWPMTQLVTGRFNVNNHAHVIGSTTECSAQWFALFYCHTSIRPMLTLQGVGRYKLTREALEAMPIALPHPMEQNLICDLVQNWDAQAVRLSRASKAAAVRLRGLMQQLLTGRRRLPAFADQPWAQVHIGDIGDETNERCRDRTNITVLSCTKSAGLVDSLEYFGRQVFGNDLSNYKVVHRHQFAYATNHIEEGSIGLLTHRGSGLVSPMYTVFRTNGEVDPSYLYRVLKTERYRQKFEAWTSASVNRRGGLRWGEFSRIKVPLPSLAEQRAIANVLEMARREIKLLEQLREQVQIQKRGLMQKLLTGQIRVPAAAAHPGPDERSTA